MADAVRSRCRHCARGGARTHTSPTAFAAADLGASSVRVILGVLTDGRIELSQTARFVTPSVSITRDGVDELHWDFGTLIASVAQGFDVAQNSGIEISSVAIDTWGVDYGRVRADGTLLEDPYNYRDSRTDGIPEKLFADIPAAGIYSRCGLQVMPFNTVFQLVAGAGQPGWDLTEQVLLLPDLIGHWFTGVGVAEVTIASTTGLLDVATRRWSAETIADVSRLYGLPLERVLPALVEPGTVGAPALRLAKPVPGSRCPRRPTDSRTSRAVRGHWSVSSSMRQSLRKRAGSSTSPTSSASTVRSATSRTSWACGSSRSRSGPGRRPRRPFRSPIAAPPPASFRSWNTWWK